MEPSMQAAFINSDTVAEATLSTSKTLDVSGSEQLSGVESIETGDDYNYHTILNLDLSSKSMIEFSVMAKNDAHVLLTMGAGGVFEIVIGGWNNSRSMIRRSKQGAGVVEYSGVVISDSEFKTFVLDWNNAGVLKLYSKSGTEPLTLLMETPPQPEPVLDIKSMAVSTGWGSTGKWKVQSHRAVTLEEGRANE